MILCDAFKHCAVIFSVGFRGVRFSLRMYSAIFLYELTGGFVFLSIEQKPIIGGVMFDDKNSGRESALQERVNYLKDQGYRGFTIESTKKKFDGVEVIVKNQKGKFLTAEGETPDEAYENAIELIDIAVDDL